MNVGATERGELTHKGGLEINCIRARAVPIAPVTSTHTATAKDQCPVPKVVVTCHLRNLTPNTPRIPTKNSTNKLWSPGQQLAGQSPVDRSILNVLCLALCRVTAGLCAVGKAKLEVDMIAVEGIPVLGRHVCGVDLEGPQYFIGAFLSIASIRQRADGRDTCSVRTKTQVCNANGVLTSVLVQTSMGVRTEGTYDKGRGTRLHDVFNHVYEGAEPVCPPDPASVAVFAPE